MEIENQIAELLLGTAPGKSNAELDAIIYSRFPQATDAQIARGATIAAEIMEAVGEAYMAEAEPYQAELAKRRGKQP